MKKINDNKVPIWKKILLAFESIVILMYVVVSVFFVWFKVDRNGFITSMSYFLAYTSVFVSPAARLSPSTGRCLGSAAPCCC